jgi:hypothetical protein
MPDARRAGRGQGEHWRASCHGKRARLVRRGPTEEDQINRYLVGGLPYLTTAAAPAGSQEGNVSYGRS